MLKRAWTNLLREPYRLFFAVGSVMAVLTMAHWFAVFHLMLAGDAYAFASRSVYQVHAQEMYYCIFAYFAFGFLLTAFPRFIERPHPAPRQVVLWVALLFLSEAALVAGLWWPVGFSVSGVLQILVYGSIIWFLVTAFRCSKAAWRDQPRIILIALALGLAGSICGHLALVREDWLSLRSLGIDLGLYGFIFFLIFGITWRVVPFFSSRVLSGYEIQRGRHSGIIMLWLLIARLILSGSAPHVLEDAARISPWLWGIDTLLLLTYAREMWRWRPSAARHFPPLFVLYLGLFWLLVYLAFSPARLLAHYAWPEAERWLLEHSKNILHFFNIGTFGTLILAVASRVTRGHGGLPLTFDRWMGLAIACMQGAMVVRVADIGGTMHFAALLWVAAFGIWAWRNLPILLREPVGAAS